MRHSEVSVQVRSHWPPVLTPLTMMGRQAPFGPQSLVVVQLLVQAPRGRGGEHVSPPPPQSLSKMQSAPRLARGSQKPAVEPVKVLHACPSAQLGASAVLQP
jgi:hypothetical protein